MTSVGNRKYGCLIYTDILVIHKLEAEKQVEAQILKNASGT